MRKGQPQLNLPPFTLQYSEFYSASPTFMVHWSKHRGYSHPHLQRSPGGFSHLGALLMKTDAGPLKEEIRRWTPHSNQNSLSSANQNTTDSNLRLSVHVSDCFSSGKLLHAPPSFTTALPFPVAMMKAPDKGSLRKCLLWLRVQG